MIILALYVAPRSSLNIEYPLPVDAPPGLDGIKLGGSGINKVMGFLFIRHENSQKIEKSRLT